MFRPGYHSMRRWIAALSALLLAAPADSRAFDTVLNLPPDPDIGIFQSIGSDTQLNLHDGGEIGVGFSAGASDGTSTNIEVNISGGIVGNSFRSYHGSTVNVTGGTLGSSFWVFDGSTAHISGGTFGNGFEARINSDVNISGGTLNSFTANSGSTVNISGGLLSSFFTARSASTVNISGGTFLTSMSAMQNSAIGISGGSLDRITASETSQISISGGSYTSLWAKANSHFTLLGNDFHLDGVPLAGLETSGDRLPVNLALDSVLSGTWADGTPFAFTGENLSTDMIADGTLTLEAAALPAIGPALIVASTDPVPLGIRQGQTLRVDNGSTLKRNFNAGLGSVVDLETGGTIEDNLEAVASQINILGGTVAGSLEAFDNSVVNVSDGSIDNNLNLFQGAVAHVSGGAVSQLVAFTGSTFNQTGGTLGSHSRALDGSTVNISGGIVGARLTAETGSILNVLGGVLRDQLFVRSGSSIQLHGGEFRLDGVPIAGLETAGNSLSLDLPAGAVLAGTLADGLPFAFSSLDGDEIAAGTLTLHATALPPVGPPLIQLPADAVPLGLRAGQTLVVEAGGATGDDFRAGRGSELRVAGGLIGQYTEVVDTTVTVTSGAVGEGLEAFGASTIQIEGGTIGQYFQAHNETTVQLTAGSIGNDFSAYQGTSVFIAGGQVGESFDVVDALVTLAAGDIGAALTVLDSTVHITGGTVGNFFDAQSSTINVSGGTIGDYFALRDFGSAESVLNMTGGTLGNESGLSGGTIHLSGGSIGNEFEVNRGTVNLTGGAIGADLEVDRDGVIHFAGGSIGEGIRMTSGSELHLYGSQFSQDGTDITANLTPFEPLLVDIRNVALEGLLVDGSSFDFFLSTSTFAQDYFSRSAEVTLTRIVQGDYNRDGIVDAGDLAVWQAGFGSTVPASFAGADGDGDRDVDGHDYLIWLRNFNSASVASSDTAVRVPEPSGLVSALGGLLVLAARFARRVV